jgi:mannitol-1-/sugar-/sorbitol-6-/2-deoxyglucose-6-phosphatase
MKRIIFDLDGVLIKTENLWREAYPTAYIEVFNQQPPYINMNALQGRRFTEVAKEFMKQGGINYESTDSSSIIAFNHSIINVMQKMLATEAEAITESIEFLTSLKKQGAKISLASSSPKPLVEKSLEILNITEYFDTVVTGDQVDKGKPHPEIYLSTAKLTQTDPSNCIVIEDSPVGVSAALAAGMSCVMLISDDSPPLSWKNAVACRALVNDLRLFDLERLLI